MRIKYSLFQFALCIKYTKISHRSPGVVFLQFNSSSTTHPTNEKDR